MYQFLLSRDIMPPFLLSTAHPCEVLSLSTMGSHPISPYKNTLLMVKDGEYEDGCDVLELFDDPVVCMSSILCKLQ